MIRLYEPFYTLRYHSKDYTSLLIQYSLKPHAMPFKDTGFQKITH